MLNVFYCPKMGHLSSATIHLNEHYHHVIDGVVKDSLEEIKVLVKGEASHILDTKNL
jgi:hypothetical protein